jgi:O-antigen ligase
MLPMALVFMWRLTQKVRLPMRVGMVLILGVVGLACLYWSGSKAGWLVAMAIGLVALGHSALPVTWKRGLISGILVLGLAAFVAKYAGFFQKEHNSVGARFGYWRVALLVVKAHPMMGTGPGTFQIPYRQLKRPDDEPTKLCHDDYLEQATDSGIPGFILYSVMISVILYRLYRYSDRKKPFDWMFFAVWLGVFGVCIHSVAEFHLYIPALAWTMFFLMGMLMGRLD